jgi:hypothetical protein
VKISNSLLTKLFMSLASATLAGILGFALGFLLNFNWGMKSLIMYGGWRNLGRPPEDAVRIIAATDTEVVVETAAHGKFSCNMEDRSECWVGTNRSAGKIDDDCMAAVPPDDTVQVAQVCYQYHAFGTISTIYALKDDGSISVTQRVRVGDITWAIAEGFSIAGALFGFLGYWAVLSIKDQQRRRRRAS